MTRTRKRTYSSRRSSGLVLLIVLGMLALFSLLAVTYVVSASASRTGSGASLVKAINSNVSISGAADSVAKSLLRGTNDQSSPFYMNDLFGDIYSPNPIRTRFGHALNAPGQFRPEWCTRITSVPSSSEINLVKLSLSTLPGDVINGPLSDFENEYNSRILTILEGPLAGQSFRILKYVGRVRGPNAAANDPNLGDPASRYAANRIDVPWADSDTYLDPNSLTLDYSVLIDLNEVIGTKFTGQFFNAGRLETASMSLADWLNRGVDSLFFLRSRNGNQDVFTGYSLLINDAAFNNPGIGLNDNPNPLAAPGFGSIDSRELMRIPSNRQKISPALLPNYDYLQNLDLMNVAVPGIGVRKRSSPSDVLLNGASNEGYDVPDWRDMWLSHEGVHPDDGVRYAIPSFHRPEVINYIANLFQDPSSLSGGEVAELLKLIDASTARILSYQFGAVSANPGFRSNDAEFQLYKIGLTNFTWSNPPTPAEVGLLQGFVWRQISGVNYEWDFDNDRDGFKESVLIDAGLPPVYSPDGRMLKGVAAVSVQDLDSRINVNTAGDRSQGLVGFGLGASHSAFRTKAGIPSMHPISQGFGYGPADISLTSIFANTPSLLRSSPASFSFFDDRYGARRYVRRPVNFNDPNLDRVPGKRSVGLFSGNDPISVVKERELHVGYGHGRLPGAPSGRRSATGMEIDRNGNLAFVQPFGVTDANPYAPATASLLSESDDDPYEINATASPNSDDPFGLVELEAVLLRMEGNANALPQRLREHLRQLPGYSASHEVNKLITTRSAELRYPNLASAAKTITQNGIAIEQPPTSMMGWIKAFHAQRYQSRTIPLGQNPNVNDDPELTYKAIEELFSTDYLSGLRMDINRAFGNGIDDDTDGQVDEPEELRTRHFSTSIPRDQKEQDRMYVAQGANYVEVRTPGEYRRESKDPFGNANPGSRPYLASRQIVARNLYCLAQLIVPRDFTFPGMNGSVRNWSNARIRAAALAQWAVNVVDFRDADAAMTRFEYDIIPFGAGQNLSGAPAARPAYWAPDHLNDSVNGVNNRQFVDVVWGMEMPELLITESFATHDMRVRDTDLDTTQKLYDPNDTNKDNDRDQYRFPEGSLFLEFYCPRTTDAPTRSDGLLLPGAPASLYTLDGQGQVALDVGRLAPPSQTWGRLPVWRVAISEFTSSNSNPATFDANQLQNLTMQTSTNAAIDGTAWAPGRSPDQVLGNGLHYDLTNTTTRSPIVFDRFVYFSNTGTSLSNGQVPDLDPSLASNAQHTVYYSRTGNPLLKGGSYLVVGPRQETSMGSATHNRYANPPRPWEPKLERANMTDATKRPILTPSFQRISLATGTAKNFLMNDVQANSQWLSRIKSPVSIVCATEPPVSTIPNETWGTVQDPQRDPFPQGVGINISLPTPYLGNSIWQVANRPNTKLNTDDDVRSDGSFGFGNRNTPPDSWIDVAQSTVATALKDKPFDVNDDPADTSPVPNSEIAKLNRPNNPEGTHENIRGAYLQRLADPELPYDPISNPYITVDWISLDLHVFNGEGAPLSPPITPPQPFKFQSRYKDGKFLAGTNNLSEDGSTSGFSYYSPSTAVLAQTPLQSDPTQLEYQSYFKQQFGYRTPITWGNTGLGSCGLTLGYVNAGYLISQNPPIQPPPLTDAEMNEPSGRFASRFDGFGPPTSAFEVSPGNYQPVLPIFFGAPRNIVGTTWLNRPFSSPYEIALVPSTGPGQFGRYHSMRSTFRKPFSNMISYQVTNPSEVDINPGDPLRSFWLNRSGNATEVDMTLLMELIETQPPFADSARIPRMDLLEALNTNPLTQRFLNSTVAPGYYYPSNFSPPANYVTQGAVRGPTLLAPFNRLPSFVAAGKINLNTISATVNGNQVHVPALKAIENNFLADAQRGDPNDQTHATDQARFLLARRGFSQVENSQFFPAPGPASGYNNPYMNPKYPTQFAGAYRPASSANLAPHVDDAEARARLRGKQGVETTLFRSLDNTYLQSAAINDQAMLFSSPDARLNNTNLTTHYPYKQLERVMRLPNLVTNQSNVFAVWITVSLYEYDPTNGFGNEYVDESGAPKRERAFYIIDRSVPVGYKPGENLNTDRAILLSRTLE